MCITSEGLLKFYDELDQSLKLLIHYRVKHKFGKSFEEIVSNGIANAYNVLVEALGFHNAELILRMFHYWLVKRGCSVEYKFVASSLGKITAEAVV